MKRAKASGRACAPGRVRIIGGRLRGSLLEVPERIGLRPTPARLRETLFNWLQPMLAGAQALDLFAGSGALGMEALSRGAAGCRFVDSDAGVVRALRANLARLGCSAGEACQADALALLGQSCGSACDLVFLDPPFAANLWADTVEALEASAWLAPQAWIYVEMPYPGQLAVPPAWSVHRRSRAGEVEGILYRRQDGIG